MAGVPVFLGYSWFALAAIVTVVLGSRVAGGAAWGYAVGLAYALVLLLSVLVHEGAHAMSSRALGLRVHRIVADFLGGHTAFDSRGLTPGRSALIAASGPAANLLLAMVSLAVGVLASGSIAGTLASGAAWINVLLAGFNLLPALPLDGGQLLEALVWGITGRRSRGMVAAGWGGRLLVGAITAYVVVWPLAQGRSPDLVSLAWGVLLGSVIWRGASQAIAVGRARAAVEGKVVGDLAQPVVTLAAHDRVATLSSLPVSAVVLIPDGPHWWWVDPATLAGPLPASATMASVAAVIPESAIVEVDPRADLFGVLTTLAVTASPVLVLTQAGQPWGALLRARLGLTPA